MTVYAVSNVTSLAGEPKYAVRFAAASRLRHSFWESRPKQIVAGPDADPANPLLWLTAVRAIKTFSAVLVLCDKGFGEQAAMLCRSLFEDFAVARWVAAHPDDVRERFLRHHEHTLVQQADTLVEHDLGHLALLPPMTDEQRLALEREFGKGRLGRSAASDDCFARARTALTNLSSDRRGGCMTYPTGSTTCCCTTAQSHSTKRLMGRH